MNDLLKLTWQQKELLRLRIHMWNGLVRIFVHPLFEKWHYPNNQYHTHPDYQRLIQIEQTVSRLLAIPEIKTPPIIIMEEHHRITNLNRWFVRGGYFEQQFQQHPYYLKTFENESKPFLPRIPRWKASWRTVIKILDSLGVKKILIGGMQFEASHFTNDWTGKPPWVSGCVGIALCHLSKDKAGKFDVDLSMLVDCPHSRRVYIQSINRHRLKQDQIVA